VFHVNADTIIEILKGDGYMKVTVKGKNIEVTEALRDYAEKKVAKIVKFFEKSPISAQVTMSTERGKHIVDITVQVDGLFLRGEEKSNDMYASIDGAIDKIERQVHKFKTKINRKLREENKVVLEASPIQGETDVVTEPQIKRTKRFAVKPMAVEEAVMQMDLLGHDFFVFLNSETEEVNVVYRRKDGHFGLIEPEFWLAIALLLSEIIKDTQAVQLVCTAWILYWLIIVALGILKLKLLTDELMM